MSETPESDRTWLRWARPWVLLVNMWTYLLGLGAAHYLGYTPDLLVAVVGLGWLLCLQAGMYLLTGAFASLEKAGSRDVAAASQAQDAIWSAFGMLAAAASLSVVLFQRLGQRPAPLALMLTCFVLLAAYALPPLKIAQRGYGEIILSVVTSNLTPMLAFAWQAGETHRLLGLVTFSLPFLHLGSLLALELETYAADLRHLRATLLLRLGWLQGVRLHNALIVAALLSMSTSLVLGLSLHIGLPVLLAFPLGAFQIWYVERIREGAPPQWRIVRLSALCLYLLPTYLLTYSLWVR